ncbi:hypothetical protein COY65_00265 [Candidatus Jorgensenbacteria bacterium CG_4_10_14_0_8_um_filter_39_13]|uniref:UPF0235 protein COY65_00265 n=2 Tax=Candidatus Joergenseniibacteriota TaxID=1752739 RepID=A0A2M7RIK6_9BACT|nr:MAG: hypothetical protein COV54_03570 [Candidatus Jorgensenbacteria bacterium CG11_big_fil_rev_8_21_14_0_20_38_23]PIV13276.1 MAG: hypothetical protein COS46_01040 [Candidatus Jorgensenbacteria bacterium CG03_land_8_20_14_0_80_38_39]PIW97455.1 MAG: hypothetical protein COZ81_02495 [Candidatus Jorgensenbacteria bacterium CG_4_8_14_3_um_filter_38_10]PIY96595.1 MAG: hypothetical protein COY65_00265 [Candidatus Jorgensenbacteria bacterium CG_4_10_14_0_8_um_filter_39_13]PJA94998.1 MAG: hypothetica
MKIFIKAKPNSKKGFVVKVSETNLIVAVKEPPVKGRANAAIQKALAEYFKVSLSRIVLVSGFSSKNKIFEIKEIKE